LTEKPFLTAARKNLLIVATVFAGLGALDVYRHRMLHAEILGAIAVAFSVIVAAFRSASEAINRGWMGLARRLGYVNTLVLLTLLYFLFLAPLGLLLRLLGRDTLRRRNGKNESYWIPREPPIQPGEQFERTF
jgi:hypothetical protein